jgi:hypothetical protein
MVRNSTNLERVCNLMRPTSREHLLRLSDIFWFLQFLRISHYPLLLKNKLCICLEYLNGREGVVRFMTLENLNPRDIHAEQVSVYEVDALVLQILYEQHKLFARRRTQSSMVCDLGDRCIMISASPFALCLGDILYLHVRDFVSTSGVRRRRTCGDCTRFCC